MNSPGSSEQHQNTSPAKCLIWLVNLDLTHNLFTFSFVSNYKLTLFKNMYLTLWERGKGKETLSVLIPNMNSTEKLSEGILTERRLFPWNSDREWEDSKKILTESCVRGILRGKMGFPVETWGQNGVSGGILRGRSRFFFWGILTHRKRILSFRIESKNY